MAETGPTPKSVGLPAVGPVLGCERESAIGFSVTADADWSVKRPVRRQTNAVQKGREVFASLAMLKSFSLTVTAVSFVVRPDKSKVR